jgi:hypothetical protein
MRLNCFVGKKDNFSKKGLYCIIIKKEKHLTAGKIILYRSQEKYLWGVRLYCN